jgi:phosphoribosylamine--glycine ligase/phosphoribosylformylglycinamidine cyclo-ligase
MAHITGGGFVENVPRVLPDGLGCFIDASTWALPPVFRFLIEKGGVEPKEMARTFNNGIGLIIVVGQSQFDQAMRMLGDAGPANVFKIGEIIPGRGVDMKSLSLWR